MDELIKKFIYAFESELNNGMKGGKFEGGLFVNKKYNYQPYGSEPHAKVLGVISKIFIKFGCDIEIERGLYKPKRFTPDIIVTENGQRIAVIEYESTHSSDNRISDRDIENYKGYISRNDLKKSDLPNLWIIITTLPAKKVKYNEWPWNPEGKKEKKKEIENPHEYWYSKYLVEINKIDKSLLEKCKLIFLNINCINDIIKVELEWPKDTVVDRIVKNNV